MTSRIEKAKKSLPVPSNAVDYVNPVRERHLFEMQDKFKANDPPKFLRGDKVLDKKAQRLGHPEQRECWISNMWYEAEHGWLYELQDGTGKDASILVETAREGDVDFWDKAFSRATRERGWRERYLRRRPSKTMEEERRKVDGCVVM